jgi:hypothetical protein
MDDYHEFYQVHEVKIENWCQYWSPNYFFTIEGQFFSSIDVIPSRIHFSTGTTILSTPIAIIKLLPQMGN